MTEQTGTELVAGDPTPRAHAHMMAISERSGVVAYASMADIIEAAKLMSQAGFAVRKHFRGNPGACMAVIQQSLRWGMDGYAVANRSYFVNDQLAFESSVIQSVILVNAPIEGRLKSEFIGEGADRRCRIWAELRDEPGEIVEYTSPRFADIKPKNSPLWTTDPDQQHYYWSARSFCRRHFPEVLLGVLDKEEAETIDAEYRDITHERETTTQKLDRIAAPKKERTPRAAAAATPAHDPETGEIKQEPEKTVAPAKPDFPELPASLDRRPKPAAAAEPAKEEPKPTAQTKSEPVKVTSGRAEPEKKADEPRDAAADERASEQEMAAAAGALDPDDDPFADGEEKEEPPHPVRAALTIFVPAAQKATTDAEMESLRKTLLKEVTKLAKDDPLYKEAADTYTREFNAFNRRKTAPKSESAPEASGEGMTPEEDSELERIITHELDHAPRGIDMNDLLQVRAYMQGLKAAQKGRAIGAVPAVYSDVEAAAWKTGHAYRTANPVSASE